MGVIEMQTHSTTTEMPGLREFLIESNRIEGLDGTSDQQVRVATTFLDLMVVTITDLAHLADVFTKGGGVLRTKPGMDVVVGDHRPPPGGPRIPEILQVLLDETNEDRVPPYEAHKEYERIHPFTDGNGRTGRLLWLWQMLDRGTNPLKHGFLHIWYYQSLAGEA